MKLTYNSALFILLLLAMTSQAFGAGALVKQSALPVKSAPVGTDRITGIDSQNGNAARNFYLSSLPLSDAATSAISGKADSTCFTNASSFNSCFGMVWENAAFPAGIENQILQADSNGVYRSVSSISGLINDAGTGTDDIFSAAETISRINTRERAASLPPASASSAGIPGEWSFDTAYYYRCIATDTWKRAELSSW